MPITFTVAAGATPVVFSTGCCGTCGEFYHRSYLAGGCREEHKTGEISISTDKCTFWTLKDKYRSAVEHEIKGIL